MILGVSFLKYFCLKDCFLLSIDDTGVVLLFLVVSGTFGIASSPARAEVGAVIALSLVVDLLVLI